MTENLTYRQKIGFTYEYYVLEQIRKDYDNVWHWKDFPEKLMYKNNLINDYDVFCKYRYDIGADLVAVKNDKYYFIQCKNFNDTILMEKLAGFYFLLYEYNLTGVLYYNGTLSQRVKDLSNKKIQFINIPFNNQTITKSHNIEIPITREYQLEAYNKLDNKKNGIIALPCGMGKTYIASLLAKKYDNIIILSPLRYLAFQMLDYFKKYLGNEYTPILISVDGKRKLDDINNYIKKKNIISSTFDSADLVIQLISKLKNVYLIVDEFHNLSDNNINNKDDNIYKLINCDYNKIFLSATPITNFMNITDIYKYEWSEAIKNKYICDFNIYIPDKNEDYQTFVELIKKSFSNNPDEKIIKKAYFMLKSMLFNGDKKCICYMTCIEFANNMCSVLEWISKLLNVEIDYWQVDCNTKKTIRENIINNFKKTSKIAIIVNVHILDEGINIPECDSVFITQPSNNMVNIIQRMCRANRILNNKTTCNIYLWCQEKKTDTILNHIYNNTNGFIKEKVFIYNTLNKNINKHLLKTTNNVGDNQLKNTENECDTNKYLKLQDILLDYIKTNKLSVDIKHINSFASEKNNNLLLEIVNEYYKFYEMCKSKLFGINMEELIKYLDIKKKQKFYKNLRKKFIENIDYVREISHNRKTYGSKYILYYLNLDTFNKICMSSNATNAIRIRNYFIMIQKFINYIPNNIKNENTIS